MQPIAHPAPSMPLALRSASGHVISQAAGYGSLIDAPAISRIDAEVVRMLEAMANGLDTGRHAQPGTSVQQDRVAIRPADMSRVRQAVQAEAQQQGADARRLSPDALFMMILGQLKEALGDNRLDSLRQRLSAHQAQLEGRARDGHRLSAALEAALNDAVNAQRRVDAADAEFGAARGAAEAARSEVDRLQAELDALPPGDPARAGKQAELAGAQQRQGAAESRLQTAAQGLVAAGNVLSDALKQLEHQRGQVGLFNAGQPLAVKEPPATRTASARLQELVTRLSLIMSDYSLTKLKEETHALMEQLKAREAENLQRAKKHEDEQARARDAEKKTGCIGKIFKWVGAAVAAVASAVVVAVGVLTANPALVVAGIIGMALTIDSMAGMATGFSLVGKMTEVIGNAIASALVAFGVSEQLARQIGSIAATIVVIVAVIAASIAAGNIAGAAQSVSRAVGLAKQVAEIMQVVGQMASMAGQVTHGVGQIIVANIMITVAQLLAAIDRSVFGSEVLRELLDNVREAASQLDRTAMDLMQQNSNLIADQRSTSGQVISNMRMHA